MTEEAIAALERECTRDVWAADNHAVDQLVAPEFTCVTSLAGPQFRIETREAWVERLKRSQTGLRIDDVAVAVYDGLAIATVLATEVAKEANSTSERVFCDVWIKAGGSWRLAERRESRPIQQ
jgi:Domain of unknown function (DUF4440)